MLDLDGTANKGTLGANAILGVSLAVAHAAADSADLPLFRYVGGPNAHVLPVPMMNILNGGVARRLQRRHPGVHDRPDRRASPSREALRWGAEVYHALKTVLKEQGPVHRPRRRGRLRPEPGEQPRRARPHPRGHRAGRLHARAATSRSRSTSPPPSSTQDGVYTLRGQGRARAAEMTAYYAEPGRRRTRWSPSRTRWTRTTGTAGRPHRPARRQGADRRRRPVRHQPGAPRSAASTSGTANALLVKVNQIGTLTETLDAVELAHRSGYRAMM